MAGKAKSRAPASPSSPGLFRPGLLTVAFALFWAAANQPAAFAPVSTTVWLLQAATIALLCQAALACLAPAVRLLAGRLRASLMRGDTT